LFEETHLKIPNIPIPQISTRKNRGDPRRGQLINWIPEQGVFEIALLSLALRCPEFLFMDLALEDLQKLPSQY
jgi:hypothetical protein